MSWHTWLCVLAHLAVIPCDHLAVIPLAKLSSCCWYLCSCPALPEDRTCPFFGFQLDMDELLGIQREFSPAPSQAAATEGGQNEPWVLGSGSFLPTGAQVELGTATSLVLAGQPRAQLGSASPLHGPQRSHGCPRRPGRALRVGSSLGGSALGCGEIDAHSPGLCGEEAAV